MREEDKQQSEFEGFLSGEMILVALLGAELALFLSKTGLRTSWDLPSLRLMLMTLYAVGGALVALLSASRFGPRAAASTCSSAADSSSRRSAGSPSGSALR